MPEKLAERLKPCPFCGAEAFLTWDYEKGVTGRTVQAVWTISVKHSKRCFFASRMNKGRTLIEVSSINKRKLMEAWNRRTYE